MKYGHDDLKSRAMLLRMHSSRDSTTIVGNSYRIVRENCHTDFCTETSHRLIYTIVNNLIDKMMESPLTDVTDVHGRPLSHSLKSFKYLNTACGILFFRFLHLFVLNHIQLSVFIKFIWSAHKTDKFNKN